MNTTTNPSPVDVLAVLVKPTHIAKQDIACSICRKPIKAGEAFVKSDRPAYTYYEKCHADLPGLRIRVRRHVACANRHVALGEIARAQGGAK